MSFWKNYKKRRGFKEGLGDGASPVDRFRFNANDDEDYAEDHEKIQTELFKVVMSKYPNETQDFLDTIIQRGDEEIRNLVRKLRKDKSPTLPREPQHPTDGDEVVPSMADRGHDMNSDQGQD